MRATGSLLMAALLFAVPLASCTASGGARSVSLPPARMTATGKAGPFAAATAVVLRTGAIEAGGFSGRLDTGTGKSFALPGPDDPADFFIVEPKAVLFAPVSGAQQNGLIILYNSSRIGPGNGTDHKALVYRIDDRGAVRLPEVEARLEGVATVAAARAKLGAAR